MGYYNVTIKLLDIIMEINIPRRALIVDDHPMILRGMKETVRQLSIEPVGALNAQKALSKLKSGSYNLIILDVDLPDIDGKSLLQLIRMSYKTVPILVVSGNGDIEVIKWMLDNGAQGYIGKSESAEATSQAIMAVVAGGRYISKNIIDVQKAQDIHHKILSRHVKITPKQNKIIKLLEKGMSNREISDVLCIAEATVGSHMKQIFKNLKVHNRTQCVKVAKNLNII